MQYQSTKIYFSVIILIALSLSTNIFAINMDSNYGKAKQFIYSIAGDFDLNSEAMEQKFGSNENTYLHLFKIAVQQNDVVVQSALVAAYAYVFMYRNELHPQVRLLKIFQSMLKTYEFKAYQTIYKKTFPEQNLSPEQLIRKAQSMYNSANSQGSCWADVALNLENIEIQIFENEEELNSFLEQS